MTRKRIAPTGLLALSLAALSSAPAWAAGNVPPYFVAVIWLSLLLLLSVPAIGFGYVLAGFLTLRASIACVVVLALVPTAMAWIARGLDAVIGLAPLQLTLLVMLGPLFVWGWHIGHRDIERQAAHRAAYENGK
jgi:hypothetical protein